MIKIAILVVCFVLSIGIMIMFPKIKNFLAAIITAGLDDLTRKLPTAALNFILNILTFSVIYGLLLWGAYLLFKVNALQ